MQVWQESSNETCKRGERAKVEHGLKTIDIDEMAKNSSSDASHSESETIENSTYEP